jgi:hypothetical protein
LGAYAGASAVEVDIQVPADKDVLAADVTTLLVEAGKAERPPADRSSIGRCVNALTGAGIRDLCGVMAVGMSGLRRTGLGSKNRDRVMAAADSAGFSLPDHPNAAAAARFCTSLHQVPSLAILNEPPVPPLPAGAELFSFKEWPHQLATGTVGDLLPQSELEIFSTLLGTRNYYGGLSTYYQEKLEGRSAFLRDSLRTYAVNFLWAQYMQAQA